MAEPMPDFGLAGGVRQSLPISSLARLELCCPEQGTAESGVQQRVARPQRDRLPMACHRFVEPFELGENKTEKAVGFRPLPQQCEGIAQTSLGLAEAAP